MDGFGYRHEENGSEPISNLASEPFDLDGAKTGAQVARLISIARGWARAAGEEEVDIDWVIFGYARHLPATLAAAGVSNIEGLRASIGARIAREPSAGQQSDVPTETIISTEVLAVLHHARGRACEHGRKESTLEDVLDEIARGIRGGHLQSAGAQLLKAHWRNFAIESALPQVMSRFDELQCQLSTDVDRVVANRLAAVFERIAAEHASIEQLVVEVSHVSERLPAVQPLPEIPQVRAPRSLKFMQRMAEIIGRRRVPQT